LKLLGQAIQTTTCTEQESDGYNHLDNGLVVKVWDQEVCFFCGFRFEPCGCSYDGHWRLTWSLISEPVRLIEVHASWSK